MRSKPLSLLLLVPALIALLYSYVWPTVRIIQMSFYDRRSLLETSPADWVGVGNYSADVVPGFRTALIYALVPLVALLIAAPALAVAAHRVGRAGRWTVRLAFVVPMVVITPVGMAFARFGTDITPATPYTAAWLSTFGLACGVGVTVALAVLRRPKNWIAGAAAAGITFLATLAIALQALALPYLLTPRIGDLGNHPPLMQVQLDLIRLRLGEAAATTTLLGVVLGVLGLAAGILVILTRLRIETAPDAPARGLRGLPVVVVILLVLLGITLWGLWPWLTAGPDVPNTPDVDGPDGWFVNSWGPPLISAVVGTAVAALAGYTVGALRPLGRHSMWLLLPFAPWLFVGLGPLSVARYSDPLGIVWPGTFGALIPPTWVVVPAVFLFALFFAGHREWKAAMPLAGLVVGATWLVHAGSLSWSLTAADAEDTPTGLTFLLSDPRARFFQEVGFALPLPMILLFGAALVVLQLWYLDRLALSTAIHEPKER